MPGTAATACLQPSMIAVTDAVALVARRKRDGEAAGIGRGVDRGDADHGDDAGHVRILAHRALDRGLQPLHLGKGDVLAALGHRGDQAGVLQRQEALRNDDVEPDGRDQRRGGDQQRERSWRSTHSRVRR